VSPSGIGSRRELGELAESIEVTENTDGWAAKKENPPSGTNSFGPLPRHYARGYETDECFPAANEEFRKRKELETRNQYL